jgi:APA family basic amino acid/polyamine antiporter
VSHKIGFWSVFSIVIGGQIGSGVFMLPSSLASFGAYSVLGWVVSGVGAISLALVFSDLCHRFPRTGGPHVYVKEMFGPFASFFTGWTYWVISWVGSAAVIISSIGYLSPFLGGQPPVVYLALEIALLLFLTWINLKGIEVAGEAEFILTVIKVIPLFILPVVAAFSFNTNNFMITLEAESLPLSTMLANIALLTLWGFIGLETATTPAGSVDNPSKTIPRAIILGTLCVVVIYVMNSVVIMGCMPGNVLAASKAPYVDVTQQLFGGDWHLIISLIASIICIGSLNAWVLSGGQIALGLAEEGLMPKAFGRKNKNDAPQLALVLSCLGLIPLLVLTASDSFSKQINAIIEFSVAAFLFVYIICCLAYLKLLFTELAPLRKWVYGIISLAFCCWILYETPLKTIGISLMFVLSGLPIHFFVRKSAKERYSF